MRTEIMIIYIGIQLKGETTFLVNRVTVSRRVEQQNTHVRTSKIVKG